MALALARSRARSCACFLLAVGVLQLASLLIARVVAVAVVAVDSGPQRLSEKRSSRCGRRISYPLAAGCGAIVASLAPCKQAKQRNLLLWNKQLGVFGW